MDRLANSFSVNRAFGIRKRKLVRFFCSEIFKICHNIFLLFYIEITICCTACTMAHLIKYKIE